MKLQIPLALGYCTVFSQPSGASRNHIVISFKGFGKFILFTKENVIITKIP